MKIFAEKKGITHYYDDKGKQNVASIFVIKKTIVGKIQKINDVGVNHYILDSEKTKTNKAIMGNYQGVTGVKMIATDHDSKIKEKSALSIKDFNEGEKLSITARGKGKGFSGTIKRFGFKRGPKTHGSRNYRKPGSIGDTGPQRVLKGKKMPGRMGFRKITLHNREVVKIISKNSEIWLKGHIPGPKKSIAILAK